MYLNNRIFEIVSKVAEECNVRAFVIGGYVRDCFLNRQCKDIDIVVVTSEICGANEILPDRDIETDIYTSERETIVIDNDLNIERIQQ